MKFIHGYPLYALGNVSVVAISEKEFESAISAYISKVKSAKNAEQLEDAFKKMVQSLELTSQRYLTLMEKRLDAIMTLAIPGDTDDSVRALNIMNFYVDLVSRLKAAGLLTVRNQQQLEEEDKKGIVKNLLYYVVRAVEQNSGIYDIPFPTGANRMLPNSSGRPLKEDEEIDLSEAMDDGTEDEIDDILEDDEIDDEIDDETDTEVNPEEDKGAAAKPTTPPEESKGMSTNTKIGLALLGGGALVLGGVLYLTSKSKPRRIVTTTELVRR